MKLGQARAIAWIGCVGDIVAGILLVRTGSAFHAGLYVAYVLSIALMICGAWVIVMSKRRSQRYLFLLVFNIVGLAVISMLPARSRR